MMSPDLVVHQNLSEGDHHFLINAEKFGPGLHPIDLIFDTPQNIQDSLDRESEKRPPFLILLINRTQLPAISGHPNEEVESILKLLDIQTLSTDDLSNPESISGLNPRGNTYQGVHVFKYKNAFLVGMFIGFYAVDQQQIFDQADWIYCPIDTWYILDKNDIKSKN